MSFITASVSHYPSPKSLSFSWNLGSLLGVSLIIQIITGFLLTFHYTNSSLASFESIQLMMSNSSWLFAVQQLHMNGASFFFLVMYFHMLKGFLHKSVTLSYVWGLGVLLFLMAMMVAFMGYVLPLGNMSYWAATVITSLFTVIPLVGKQLVLWLWGSYFISDSMLKLFFTLHFVIPLAMLVVMLLHLLELHKSGSTSKLGAHHQNSSVSFSMFMAKDLTDLMAVSLLFMWSLVVPLFLSDPESYTLASMVSSPVHISPEWYFLWVYAILRSIPNKTGGVVCLLLSVVALFFLPIASKNFNSKVVWGLSLSLILCFLLLTFIGMQGVEPPFILLGQVFTLLYFILLSIYML